MEKNEAKLKSDKGQRANGRGVRLPSAFCLLPALLALSLFSCRWKPSFPADRIASSLRHMCSTDYKLSVETRHVDNAIQVLVWKVGLFKGSNYELQGVNRDALDAMDHVLLCATRVALSTDAALDFIEITLADVLTGATVTLWRYVPDIRDSMYQRIGDTEYFNRLVIEIEPGKSALRKGRPSAEREWDRPLTMSEFLAKQIILRARRDGAESLEAHADLSEPATLGVVIENWSAIEDEGADRVAKVSDLVHQSAEKVVHGYGFTGFRGITLRNSEGVALNSWAL
jgi:hypothetical protein